jgi:hypothetical protein
MGWSRRQNLPSNDPDAGDENNPLADNMRLRPRRSATGPQPVEPDTNGSIHDQHTLVDSNFASRSRARRERQIATPFSTQQIGSWAADPKNSRQLLMIGGAVLIFLLLIGIISVFSSGSTPDTATEPAAASPSAAANVGGNIDVGPAASTDPGTGTQPATNIPGTDPGQQPVNAGGGAFTVSGTGSEGLFLRQDHSTTAQVLATLPEGTKIESLGDTFNDGSRDWLKVRSAQGEGWVAKQYLQPAQ